MATTAEDIATAPVIAQTNAPSPEVQKQMDTIFDGLDEVLDPQIIQSVLEKGDRPLRIYWGTAPTGKPHVAYFVPIIQIAKFLAAGCEVTVLVADIHAFLDNLKAPIELVEFRAKYYEFIIKALLRAVNVPIDRLKFVKGTSYQNSAKYSFDVLRASAITSTHDARRAGSEVVKQAATEPLASLLYPCLQCLDEVYLNCDAQFGGVDQRKIFVLSKTLLPKLGYTERAHLMNPMVPGLTGGKMSASDPNSKIDVLDTPEDVTKKIKKAVAVPKIVEENGLLAFVHRVLLPASNLKNNGAGAKFVVERRDQEPLVYTSYEKMTEDYAADVLTPQDLKPAVSKALNELLAPVQAEWLSSEEWQTAEKQAYPPDPSVLEAEAKKAAKKAAKASKGKGTGAPGAQPKEAETLPMRPKPES